MFDSYIDWFGSLDNATMEVIYTPADVLMYVLATLLSLILYIVAILWPFSLIGIAFLLFYVLEVGLEKLFSSKRVRYIIATSQLLRSGLVVGMITAALIATNVSTGWLNVVGDMLSNAYSTHPGLWVVTIVLPLLLFLGIGQAAAMRRYHAFYSFQKPKVFRR